MVITVLEAQVAPEKAQILEATYKQAIQRLDAGIKETFLLHGTKDPSLWQIITIWESHEALDAMKQSGETPRGVVIFQSAGVETRLSVFEIVAHATVDRGSK